MIYRFVVVKREHFNNSCCLRSASFIGSVQRGRHRLVQHHAGYGQCLSPVIAEERIDVGYELSNPGIEVQAFAQAGNQPAGERVSLIFTLYFTQADRANPDMRRARDRVGGFQRAGWQRKTGLLFLAAIHASKLDGNAAYLLSNWVEFCSMQVRCSTNQRHWPRPPRY
jgi:hypothetical protein